MEVLGRGFAPRLCCCTAEMVHIVIGRADQNAILAVLLTWNDAGGTKKKQKILNISPCLISLIWL